MPVDLHTPEWVKHAVFYQVFPDRFARSGRVPLQPSGLEPWGTPPTVHGYKGGDLYGVADRLDHLEDLGVTALYLNPIFASGSNHRYHTHDYFTVDPMLGGDAALRHLLDTAHARGMKVVLDGVFNHASRGFLPFHDLMENGEASPYRDWFHVHGFPLGAYGEGGVAPQYECWWNIPALPKLNTDTPQVRAYLLSVAEHWLRFGIDGWRLDVPNEIDDDAFWREFRRRCRAVNPEAYLVGEIWDDAGRWLQGDQFDAVMNYPITKAILGFAAREVDRRRGRQVRLQGARDADRRGLRQGARGRARAPPAADHRGAAQPARLARHAAGGRGRQGGRRRGAPGGAAALHAARRAVRVLRRRGRARRRPRPGRAARACPGTGRTRGTASGSRSSAR